VSSRISKPKNGVLATEEGSIYVSSLRRQQRLQSCCGRSRKPARGPLRPITEVRLLRANWHDFALWGRTPIGLSGVFS